MATTATTHAHAEPLPPLSITPGVPVVSSSSDSFELPSTQIPRHHNHDELPSIGQLEVQYRTLVARMIHAYSDRRPEVSSCAQIVARDRQNRRDIIHPSTSIRRLSTTTSQRPINRAQRKQFRKQLRQMSATNHKQQLQSWISQLPDPGMALNLTTYS
jgi:hypothetical protein